MFDHIKELTDLNDHTLACIEGCEFIGLNDLADEFREIQNRCDFLGYLPHDLSEKRYKLYKKMLAKAKPLLGNLYQDFYMSF